MSLSVYNEKRHFSETPEPRGKEKPLKGVLRFVIQKHDASSLHYDFRLEMGGVLKSWAVPKGPSLRPADKRLAMQVEDHPYDYRHFEGVIPQNNYGAGTVIIWDEGTYEPADGAGLSRKEQEQLLLQQWEDGQVRIVLHGTRLKGGFALLRMKNRGGNSWMLVKKKDAYAADRDITEEDASVRTGKTLTELALEQGTEVRHPEGKAPIKKPSSKAVTPGRAPAKRAAAKKSPKAKAPPKKSPAAEAAPMPRGVKPMLATLVEAPFDSDDWIFEIKWDGYRALAYAEGGAVALISRNNKPFTGKYRPVAEALQGLGRDVVLDGEIVAVDEKGLANFQLLQNWQNAPVQLQFFIFDILWLDGRDLTGLPLLERKRILYEVLPKDDAVIRYSDHVAGQGNKFFKAALAQGLEGIMAKRAGSSYQVATRTPDWVKIKVNLRQEVIIAGFTQPRNSRKFFGALLLGVYDREGTLVYVGHTGSGFNTKSLEAIYKKLQPLVTPKSPFARAPRANMPATWVKPALVCEIKFTEWTKEGIARHPIFMGLREDKKPEEVTFEKATDMATLKDPKRGPGKTAPANGAAKKTGGPAAVKKTAAKKAAAKGAPKKGASKAKGGEDKAALLDLQAGEEQLVTLNGQELKLTNLSKLYWPKEGFSKGDMINYYLEVAPYLLPYMTGRPQSLNRHPNGVGKPSFYQKDMRGKIPGWIPTHEDFSESTGTTVQYLVCNNEATLVYMANLGCIEMNPWHSRSASWQQPDWCLIDLDPDKTNTFEQVMETARVTKKVLDSIGADAWCKTSGATGIHIYIPLGARYSFAQSKQLAELVVTLVNRELPQMTSLERNPAKRKGRIYLDFLQNSETKTAAAPYSLRPKPGMPVSTPLDWSELKKGLTPATWTARNIFERLTSEGDLFAPVLGKGVDLEKIIRKLETLV